MRRKLMIAVPRIQYKSDLDSVKGEEFLFLSGIPGLRDCPRALT
jgi:hypothetical protein